MTGNREVSPANKLNAVKEYLDGKGSLRYIAKSYNVNKNSLENWISKYKAFGDTAFIRTGHNAKYTESFKKTVVETYLNGEGSLSDIATAFKIPAISTVIQWVSKYNSHEKLRAYNHNPGGNATMTNGRKTTYDERIQIIKYCIEHSDNYKETASKYSVSYQQVYSWCKKYKTNGVEALQDRRGRAKPESEMSQVDKLLAENKLLKAENRRKDLENIFLKKLQEIERGEY